MWIHIEISYICGYIEKYQIILIDWPSENTLIYSPLL